MNEYLADTNVFITLFKGNNELEALLLKTQPAINSIVYLELIQGAKSKKEIRRIEEYLTAFELHHFDESISNRSIDLIRTYSTSHGLRLPDAVIAATCLENDFTLITFNIKDFRFIDGLKILDARNEAF